MIDVVLTLRSRRWDRPRDMLWCATVPCFDAGSSSGCGEIHQTWESYKESMGKMCKLCVSFFNIHTYIDTYIHTYLPTHAYIYTDIYICINMCMCIHIYNIYNYIYIRLFCLGPRKGSSNMLQLTSSSWNFGKSEENIREFVFFFIFWS